MSKSSDAVKRWRKNTKLKVIQSMGGCCQICGYDKCPEAMDLHHIDPTKKEISFGQVTANPKAWSTKIVPELKKCILLCSNCHREFHAGYVELPETFAIFDESLICDKINKEMYDNCPVCNKQKSVINNYCSVSCNGKANCNTLNKYNRVTIDDSKLIEMYNAGLSQKKIGDYFLCSDDTIRLRLKKLNVYREPTKVEWPSVEKMQEYIWKSSLVDLSKELNVSDESIRSFIKKHNLYRPNKKERMAHMVWIEQTSNG